MIYLSFSFLIFKVLRLLNNLPWCLFLVFRGFGGIIRLRIFCGIKGHFLLCILLLHLVPLVLWPWIDICFKFWVHLLFFFVAVFLGLRIHFLVWVSDSSSWFFFRRKYPLFFSFMLFVFFIWGSFVGNVVGVLFLSFACLFYII